MMAPTHSVNVGDVVELTGFDDGCIIPDGTYTVSYITGDGWFHVDGNTAVSPSRIARVISRAPTPATSTHRKDQTP